MRTYRYLERPTKIWGIPMDEAIFLAFFPLGLLFVTGALRYFLPLSGWVYLFIIAISIGLWIIVSKANKRNHPSFIKSGLSYWFLQPKKITIINPKIQSEKIPTTSV